MKPLTDDTDRSDENTGEASTGATAQFRLGRLLRREFRRAEKFSLPDKLMRISPRAMLLAMVCALLLADAVLPLRDLWFREALLTQMGPWPVAPSLLLFPGWAVLPPIPAYTLSSVPDLLLSWKALALLVGAFALIFLIYICALRYLPGRISRRFITRSPRGNILFIAESNI